VLNTGLTPGPIPKKAGWIKRLRDMRRLAETRAPGVFLPPPPHDFVGRAEALEMLYATLVRIRAARCSTATPAAASPTLALKSAWQTQGAFDAVVFQLCGQRPVAEIATELAAKFKLGLETKPPEEQIAPPRHGEPGRSVCAHQNPEDHERDKNQVYDVSDGKRLVS
jgi:hypothetical protein